MSKVRVATFSLSLDGYGAGPGQTIDHPLGAGGMALHEWALGTQTFHKMFGKPGGSTGVDEKMASRGMQNLGAWILGRNMFGPIRGPWPDLNWQGWWGENPPYGVPVFVLTHHPRPSLPMEGGTVFHFVTDGIHSALEKARAAAKGKDIRIGGGVSTIRQYLEARLIDEMQITITSVLLGKGESFFHGLDLPALGYRVKERLASETVDHVTFEKI